MSSSSTNSQDPSHSHQHQQHAGWTDKTNTPASPTHFLSRASRRLPELQLQLQLNPELNATELLEPTETEPLLSYHSHITHQQASHEPPIHASSSYNQHQSQSCLSTRPPNSNHQRLPSSSSSSHHIRLPPKKLNTFDGVFLPTILSIFNVVYFMRFGYCIGQIGLLATISLLGLAYLINILTVFSLSAIATNGQVRGGGAYYLISRTLGPEFGGSIGILFCLSQAMTAAMNIIGFIEAVISIVELGLYRSQSDQLMKEDPRIMNASTSVIRYFFKTGALLGATLACILLGKQKIFCSMTRSVSLLLLFTLLSMLFSFTKKSPFSDSINHLNYTSFSFKTIQKNLYPDFEFIDNSNGTSTSIHSKFSDYQRVFGIIFPSLSGILAGSSLSGELRKPSKSLPTGMISASIVIIIVYLITLICLSLTCTRESFMIPNQLGFLNLIALQISSYPGLMSIGLLLCTLFSSIMGITVCGKVLQAVSRDGLIPIMKPFFSQGSLIGDDPVYSILLCFIVCQIALFCTVSQLAIHITTISLLVFACINLACFTLRVAGSPNFRPSFRLFSEWTALLGLALALLSMYLVGPVSASTSIIAMIALFVIIHYSSPAKQWGEVTQSIIYHQVRKYLLRLDERKDNVKYWRPQILLFTNDPRHDWNQIVFCNSLKKGGLYVLAHIIKSEFSSEAIKELQEQQLNWLGLVDISNIKAFVDLTLAPDERVGARQLLLTAGLGGMRPNICILGFPTNLKWRGKGKLLNDQTGSPTPALMKRRSDSSMTVRGMVIESTADLSTDCLGSLPTDSQRSETPIKPTDFVGIIEDTLSLNKSIGLTYGFQGLQLPGSISRPQTGYSNDHSSPAGNSAFQVPDPHQGKQWIDLWPILRDGESGWETYTMVLQLGTILSMVPSWRHHHNLRVTIFCEYDADIAEERRRMEKLMSDLRIRADLRVVVLANGHIQSYECLVKGKAVDMVAWSKLERTLAGDPWWETLKFMRAQDSPRGETSARATTRERASSRSESVCSALLDRNLLKKNDQPNIRIKALHPLSRRGSHQTSHSTQSSVTATGDDDDDLILEENDGDDDTIAREAYTRNKKPVGLPDDPVGVQSKTTAHRISIPDYGSTFEHQSLDLLSLSPSSLHNDIPSPPPTGVEICHERNQDRLHFHLLPQPRSQFMPKAGLGLLAHLRSQIVLNPPKGLASVLHRKKLLNKSPDMVIEENAGQVKSTVQHRIKPERNSSAASGRMKDLTQNYYSSSSSSSSSSEGGPASSSSSSGPSDNLPPTPSPSLLPPVVQLDFNSLPMHAQLICLNELIRFHSDHSNQSSSSTAIIFTSLPPPENGTSSSFEGSARYLDQLESFLNDLPPVLAIYAKQFTVTASL
ncbi:hypothetical protein Pst134EA_025830 [Puccinia striiformis f. sp. tritici]|uniref:hypothetical protein n=1 Tax=Puccinia striiformis f. sp. tritici TaxID=168172 RepID=UPI002008CDE8|nr:hypothetical protein Pst134EA_025830 [Puccinia striiformis f. sp. tritici]KAH9451889.1 hypothetical protein Pst134EA_025830 [Puccinia striiformis f. sp. tritici]